MINFKNSLVYKNKTLKINLAYDVVLDFFSLLKEDIAQELKIITAFKMFCDTNKSYNLIEMSEILSIIRNEFINFLEESKASKSNKKAFDFVQDEKYIYPSFLECYGIDIYKEKGKLDWRKFYMLFMSLNSKCKIKEVIKIRTMEIPKPNKSNSKQIKNILEAKQAYKLELTEEERENQFNQALKNFAERIVENERKQNSS